MEVPVNVHVTDGARVGRGKVKHLAVSEAERDGVCVMR